MSRMPTMTNYTDFHEWLDEFIPGIFSDEFTLTPGIILILSYTSRLS